MNANNAAGGAGNGGTDSAGVGGGVTGQMPVLEREEPSVWHTLARNMSLQRMGAFLRLNGTGILYALSAMSILYGMGRIIGPILATSGKLGETLPCFGALQGYELALFAVLLLIVLWRQKTRDSTTLMVLVALFMGASGITLATIANDGPVIAGVIGAGCMAVAFGKIWVLRSKIGMVCSGLFMAGLSALLVWNFLVSPYMALTLHREWPGSGQLRLVWLGGWHVMLFGAALLFVSALISRTGGARRAGPESPFLRSTGMAWAFALVLIGGAIVHQYALTYIFDVRFAVGDFLPIAVIGAAAILEIMRRYGIHGSKADVALALAPFVLVFAVVREHAFLDSPQWGLGTLFQPWAVLALAGLGLLVIAIRRRDKILAGIALLYAPFAVALVGALPVHPIGSANVAAFGATFVTVLFVLAILYRSVELAYVALTIVAAGVAIYGGTSEMAVPVFSAWPHVFLAVFGVGALGLYLGFPRHVQLAVGILGAAALAFAAVHGQPDALAFRSLALAVALVVLGGLTAWRARDFVTAAILAVPLLWRAVQSMGTITGWHYIALSFVLLGAGAFFSLKSRHPNGG